MIAKLSEEEVAAPVVYWLQEMGWEVYQEVAFFSGDKRADIVAVKGKLLWIIEVKTSCSVALLEQANNWLNSANYISIAVPDFTRSTILRQWCINNGVGVIVCSRQQDWDAYPEQKSILAVREVFAPKVKRNRAHILRARLTEKHKSFAKAGNSSCKYWTPFQQTVENIQKIVREYPGIPMSELLLKLEHHYSSKSSARCALGHWGLAGKITGVKVEKTEGKIKFYPEIIVPA